MELGVAGERLKHWDDGVEVRQDIEHLGNVYVHKVEIEAYIKVVFTFRLVYSGELHLGGIACEAHFLQDEDSVFHCQVAANIMNVKISC